MLSEFITLETAPFQVHILLVLMALAGLWIGSEVAVRNSVNLARMLAISPLIIGLTIVSIISSLPEIFINVSAGLSGNDDIAAGNVVGSCLVQISFVLGVCALAAGGLSVDRISVHRDSTVLIASVIAFIYVSLDGKITVMEGWSLILAFVLYLILIVLQTRQTETEKSEDTSQQKKDGKDILLLLFYILLGCSLVWVMADILVLAGSDYAKRVGISQGIIGMWTGVSTSLPELAISIIAILRGSAHLSAGNLIGSNITDPLLSLGIGATVANGLDVSNFIAFHAAGLWLLVTFLVVFKLWRSGEISRSSGAGLIILYIVIQTWLSFNNTT